MRLISQNGMIDVSYEQVGLTISNSLNGKSVNINAHCMASEANNVMGKYASEEIAKYVLSMLRSAFVCQKVNSFFIFPDSEDVCI